jgi:hypothetical protein
VFFVSNPSTNRTHSIPAPDDGEISIKLWDKDKVGSDFLGEVNIKLDEIRLKPDHWIKLWFDVENEPKKSKKPRTEGGSIQVALYLNGELEASYAAERKFDDFYALRECVGRYTCTAYTRTHVHTHVRV